MRVHAGGACEGLLPRVRCRTRRDENDCGARLQLHCNDYTRCHHDRGVRSNRKQAGGQGRAAREVRTSTGAVAAAAKNRPASPGLHALI